MWDLIQHLQIEHLSSRAALSDTQSEMHRAASRSRDEVIADDVASLALVAEAMWSILSERLGVTEDELLARVRELDLTDGRSDGRRARPARTCSGCQAKVPNDRDTCQFCGAASPGRAPFA